MYKWNDKLLRWINRAFYRIFCFRCNSSKQDIDNLVLEVVKTNAESTTSKEDQIVKEAQ